MKKRCNFFVFFCFLAVCLVSCSDAGEFEYVDTVEIEAIISDHDYRGEHVTLVYRTDDGVKTVHLGSSNDQASRIKTFRTGDEVLLYKHKWGYYISSEKLVQQDETRDIIGTIAVVFVVGFVLAILGILFVLSYRYYWKRE